MADLTFTNDELTLHEMRVAYRKLMTEGRKPYFTATVTPKVRKDMEDGEWLAYGFVPRRLYGPWGEETASPNEFGAMETMRLVAE
jgi:hypothetical protein